MAETLRKIGIFVAWPTRGPCVAHSKFGPILGIEPVPNGTPCIALRYPATCDSAPPNKRRRALVKDWCLAKPDPSRSNVDRSSQHQRGPKPISLPVSAIGYRLSAIAAAAIVTLGPAPPRMPDRCCNRNCSRMSPVQQPHCTRQKAFRFRQRCGSAPVEL